MKDLQEILSGVAWEIFQKAQIIICVISPDGKTIYLNPWGEKVTGYSLQEIEGKDWWETLYPGTCYQQVKDLFEAIKEAPNVENYKMILRTKSNKQRHVLWDSCNIFNEDGLIKFIVGTGADITEVREADQKIFRKKNVATSLVLTGGLSNDLNNLLSGLLGSLELAIKNFEKDPKKALSWLKRAQEDVKKMTDLSRQIAAFSQGYNQEIKLINASSVLLDIVGNKKISHPKIIFDCHIGKDIEISAKLGELRLLMENILKNAIKASIGEKGGVFVALTSVNRTNTGSSLIQMLKLTVKDSGCGMDQDVLKEIFDPYVAYFEAPPSRKGIGLGLAIVQQIVERMKGFVEVESSIGKGSTFIIFLPLKEQEAEVK